jgi:hypothetical protein
MKCNVCSSNAKYIFSATILQKHKAEYFHCAECGFLFAKEPFWLEEAYSSAIADADTGLVTRNIQMTRRLSCVLSLCCSNAFSGRYVDIAGGYGMLTRMMRDVGFDFYWFDKYCENIFARGFDFSNSKVGYDALTAVEVLEHVSDPIGFIEESLSFAGSEMMIFTTELYEGDPPSPEGWWYYTFGTGQHISFYQERTFEFIAKKIGYNFVSVRGLHILSRKKVGKFSLWLATHPVVSRLGELWIRRKLISKTISDHELMLSRVMTEKDVK